MSLNCVASSLSDSVFLRAHRRVYITASVRLCRTSYSSVIFVLLAVDLLIRGGESQGVIHEGVIDEDIDSICFVNSKCPQVHFMVFFSVIQRKWLW